MYNIIMEYFSCLENIVIPSGEEILQRKMRKVFFYQDERERKKNRLSFRFYKDSKEEEEGENGITS